MFKIGSYITPIILNEIGKYVKDFNPEDFQISLWEGEVAFQNLNVRFDVIQENLKLPVEFISGRIRELTVTVPWSRITSQSIVISIDTLEVLMNLKKPEAFSNLKKEPQRKVLKVEEPPGYLSTMIKRILANISVNCKHIILKIFADNIAFSLNVRQLSVCSVKRNWQNGVTDINPLRKVIEVTDLSICIDRANEKGTIDVTFEPILNKSSFEIRSLRRFNLADETSSTLVIHVFSKFIDICISSLQYPMMMQLLTSVILLLKEKDQPTNSDVMTSETQSNETNPASVPNQSYFGWAWNKIPNLLPAALQPEIDPNNDGHYKHFGVYIEELRLNLKSSKIFLRSVMTKRIMRACLNGIYSEILLFQDKWLNFQAGITSLLVEPLGKYSPDPSCYFVSVKTDVEGLYLNDSLFKCTTECNNFLTKFTTDVNSHIEKFSETYLLSKGTALAVDIVYIPREDTSKKVVTLDDLFERLVVRFITSSAKLSFNSALTTVVDTIQEILSLYKMDSEESSGKPKDNKTQQRNAIRIPQGNLEILLAKLFLDLGRK